MTQVTIRKASLNDLEILLGFEQQIINAERLLDHTIKPGEVHFYDIAAMIAAPDVEIIVAEAGTQIIGSGFARVKNSEGYYKHQNHAYLGFMYVVPDYRGKGINKMILEHLMQWCRSQNITELKLEVYNDNPRAIKAYEKAGFKKHFISMRLGLDEIDNASI